MPKAKMIKARAALILDEPFFGSLALRLELEDNSKLTKTLATDGKKLVFNPDYVKSISMDELKGIVCHEVLHIAAGHHVRRGERDSKIWNIACDYAINPLCLDAKLKLPNGYLYKHEYLNKTAEEIYSIECQKQKEEEQQNKAGGGSKGDKQGESQAGEVLDFPGENGEATESEKQEQEAECRIAATQAANQAKACGNLPNALKEMIDTMNEPKICWKEVLQRFISQIARDDYTFKHINQRYIHTGICLPSLYNEKIGKIVLAVDTSGSISRKDKERVASELEEIIRQFNADVHVVYCDYAVTATEDFTIDNLPIKLNAVGGGGTAFSPVFKYVETMEEAPACVVYITDMCCNDFGNAPDCPVLWINTYDKRQAPFGETIRMKGEV